MLPIISGAVMSRTPRKVQEQIDIANNIQTQIVEGDPPDKGAELDKNKPPAKPDQETDWEHRFKTQKQKYDETVPVLRKENQELGDRVTELEKLIEKAKPDADDATHNQPIFSPEEIEEYGADFLAVVERVAGRREDPSIDIAKELNELKAQFNSIAEVQAKTDEDRFFDDLVGLVPDWEAVNEDEDFKKWLSEEMPLTGKERQFFLIQAQKALNARKVASFFAAWKGESGQQTYLFDTVQGGEGGGETVATEDYSNEIITKAEIKQFYDDLKLGRYRKNEEEARQIEMRIFRAQRENRVR
jgi:hypothetical protein